MNDKNIDHIFKIPNQNYNVLLPTKLAKQYHYYLIIRNFCAGLYPKTIMSFIIFLQTIQPPAF